MSNASDAELLERLFDPEENAVISLLDLRLS
jgi:hypothetical protein